MTKVQLIIKNAEYYMNDAFFKGNIVVDGGKIVGITQLDPQVEAERVIDAEGKKVLPGIVDSTFTSEILVVMTVKHSSQVPVVQ